MLFRFSKGALPKALLGSLLVGCATHPRADDDDSGPVVQDAGPDQELFDGSVDAHNNDDAGDDVDAAYADAEPVDGSDLKDSGHPPITTLGPEGGTLWDDVTGLVLKVPAGVLLGETTFTFSAQGSLPHLPSYLVARPGSALHLSWTGAGFVPRAVLAVSYQVPVKSVEALSGGGASPRVSRDELEFPLIAVEECSVVKLAESGANSASPTSDVLIPDSDFVLDCPEQDGGPSAPNELYMAVVDPAPGSLPVLEGPVDTVTVAGEWVTFVGWAQGAYPLSVQWLRNGVPISGATNADYVLHATVADDGARFSFTVTNALGSIVSREATLSLTGTHCAAAISPANVTEISTQGHSASNPLVAGPDGAVWFIDQHRDLCSVRPDGGLTALSSSLLHIPELYSTDPMTFDHAGNLWISTTSALYRRDPTGKITRFDRPNVPGIPTNMTVDRSDNLWIGWSHSDSSGALIRVTPAGQQATFLTNGNPFELVNVDSSIHFIVHDYFYSLYAANADGVVTREAHWPGYSLDYYWLRSGSHNDLWFLEAGGADHVSLSGDHSIVRYSVGSICDTPVQLQSGVAMAAGDTIWARSTSTSLPTRTLLTRMRPGGIVDAFEIATTSSSYEYISGDSGTIGTDGSLWLGTRGSVLLKITPP
jgi:sugar lactone lactonase YvrE